MTRIDADAMADSGGDPVLLVGGQAVALADRLQAPDTSCSTGVAALPVGCLWMADPIQAAILADDQADRISDLRSCLGRC